MKGLSHAERVQFMPVIRVISASGPLLLLPLALAAIATTILERARTTRNFRRTASSGLDRRGGHDLIFNKLNNVRADHFHTDHSVSADASVLPYRESAPRGAWSPCYHTPTSHPAAELHLISATQL